MKKASREWENQFCSSHIHVSFKNQAEKDAHLATHEWKPLQKGLQKPKGIPMANMRDFDKFMGGSF